MSKRVAAKRAAARGKRSKRDDDDQNEESFLSDMPEDGKLLSAAEIRSAEYHNNFNSLDIARGIASRCGGVKRTFKSRIAAEYYDRVPASEPTWINVAVAPSSNRPIKYCDITGLPTNYTDPKTHLHFVDADAFQLIRQLPEEQVTKLLSQRGAAQTLH